MIITQFKIFENKTIYKKGDYIFWDNAVQKIHEVELIGTTTTSGEKVIRFIFDNDITDERKAKTLYEDEIVLPTDEQIKYLKDMIEAKKISKKYNL